MDSYVSNTGPTDNHGSETTLYAWAGPSGKWYAYLNFDFSAIPAGSTIDSATLTIFNATYSYSGANAINLDIYAVGSGWAEGTITWNNMTAVIGSASRTVISSGTAGGTKSYDVTTA